MELIRKGDLPLTPSGLEKMRPDLEMSKEAIKSLFRISNADAPKSFMLICAQTCSHHSASCHLQGG